MNTENLKERFTAFRTHPATQKATEIGKQVLTAAAVGIAIKVTTFIVVAGTKALIEEINNQANKTN